MKDQLAPVHNSHVKKTASSCEIYSGPHDTQYFMENPKKAFADYASSHTDEAGGKWWRQPQNSQNNFSNPPNRFHPNNSFPNRSFNNNP